MAALNNVIYGDCRSASISSTLSSFLRLGSPPKKKIEYSCGYDPSLFINQEEIEKYICPICQHVVKEAMNIGCGNNHIFCSKCFEIYQNMNEEDDISDNNVLYYGVGNSDWNMSNDPTKWNPNTIKMKSTIKCPLCQNVTREWMSQKLPCVDEKIRNELIIKCPLETNSCQWKGTLSKLDAHQSETCPYQNTEINLLDNLNRAISFCDSFAL